MRFALVDSNNTIILFMHGPSLTMADSPMTVSGGKIVEVPDGEWEIGDTFTTVCNSVMIGNGIPSNKHGMNGACFVDLDSGLVYKKQNNTWF